MVRAVGDAEELDPRAGAAVAALVGRPLPSGRSTSEKTAPKPLTVAGVAPLRAGHEEEAVGDVAAHGREEAQRAEGAKIVA